MKNSSLLILIALIAAILAGCGGGGSSGSGGSAKVNLFATDDLSTGYDAVWVKIYRVDVRRDDSTLSNLFSDAAGKVIDLRALNDGTNLYSFFGHKSVPVGTYTAVLVELDRAVTLFPTGSSAGQNRVFDDAYGADRARIEWSFPAPVNLGAGSNRIIADFDLSQWQDVSGEIRNAAIVQGDGAGFENPGRHQNEDYTGTVESLSGVAPNYTFVLRTSAGSKIEVETNSNTAIFNNSGQPNPTIANGTRVEVRGSIDPSTMSLSATSIKIKNSGDNDEFEAKGLAGSANGSTRTFQITVREACGFIPSGTTVTVQVDDSTRFFSDRGVLMTEAAFFEAIGGSTATFVEAEGTVYNASTQTLTAKKCKLEDGQEGNGDVEARGAPSNIDPIGGTFSMSLTSWEGFSATPGQSIAITTSGGTEYKDGNNQGISKAQFFALLASATTVKVEGRYENGILAARECSLRLNGGGGGGEDPHEGKGTPSNIDSGARTFTLTLFEWYGFGGSVGLQVSVQMTSNATYRSDNGESMSQAEFFAAMGSGWLVEVEGTFSGGVFTGVKAKLDDH